MTPSSTSPRHKILLVSGSVLAQLALLLLVHPVFAAVVPLAGFLLLREEEDLFSAFWRATLLGGVACAGVLAATSLLWPLVLFGWYLIVLSFFHLSEYLATAATNPENLSTDSFLLNHSAAYNAAAVASWVEFFAEVYFLGDFKSGLWAVSVLGLVICAVGEVLRKSAMVQAGRSFNHVVQVDLGEDHKLVTEGVFSLVRHPSYVGWFYWSMGTQLVLCNPLCVVAYAAASYAFFRERVLFEEWTLLKTYRGEYERYQKQVPTGLPFIRGYQVERQ